MYVIDTYVFIVFVLDYIYAFLRVVSSYTCCAFLLMFQNIVPCLYVEYPRLRARFCIVQIHHNMA